MQEPEMGQGRAGLEERKGPGESEGYGRAGGLWKIKRREVQVSFLIKIFYFSPAHAPTPASTPA